MGVTPANISSPVRLTAEHDRSAFSSGEGSLDEWLREQAPGNELRGASRTYVVCEGLTVIGYYGLATGSIFRSEAPKRLQRNMPNPIPVMVLGRLAIDHRYQRRGIGQALVKDASFRVLQAAEIAGIRAILVHAMSVDAKTFYLKNGFIESMREPMTLCLPLEDIRRTLGRPTV